MTVMAAEVPVAILYCGGSSSSWQTRPRRGGVESGCGTQDWTASALPAGTLNHSAPVGKGEIWGRPQSPSGFAEWGLESEACITGNYIPFRQQGGGTPIRQTKQHILLLSAHSKAAL